MYGIRDGYKHRLTPAYFVDNQPDGKTWQPYVLPIAAYLGRKAGVNSLVDIGCGRGEKLIYFEHDFYITGIDYGENFEYCQSHYHTGLWLECDLEYQSPVLPPMRNVVVCSDVIEHLKNPYPLVGSLMGESYLDNIIVISTPDRQRLYGYDHPGEPSNPHHVREWTLAELRSWLATYNMTPSWAGYTLNNNVDRELSTSLLIFGAAEYVNELDRLFTLERVA